MSADLVWVALGGAACGLGGSGVLLLLGRVAGISGMCASTLFERGDDTRWRVAFIAGLAAAGALSVWLTRHPAPSSPTGPLGLVIGGVLIGFGSRLGSGCTSGHGVCGVGRLSPRSIVAVTAFSVFGAVALIVRRWMGV